MAEAAFTSGIYDMCGGVVGAWYAEFAFIVSRAAALLWRFRSRAWEDVII